MIDHSTSGKPVQTRMALPTVAHTPGESAHGTVRGWGATADALPGLTHALRGAVKVFLQFFRSLCQILHQR
jgi:hypothetical protein